MMKSNKTKSKKKGTKKAAQPSHQGWLTPVVDRFLDELIGVVATELHTRQRSRLMKQWQDQCISVKQYRIIKRNIALFMDFEPEADNELLGDSEPKPPPMDNLHASTITTKPAESLLSPKHGPRKAPSTPSSLLTSRSASLPAKKLLQLPLEPIDELRAIKQLRQQKIRDQQLAQQEAREETEPVKRKSKSVASLNFDYSGQILHSKPPQDQDNLVEKLLVMKRKKQKIVKKTEETPEAEGVQTKKKPYRRERNQKSKLLQGQFTEFLDNQSLAESVDITHGIRFAADALVFEEKKKALSTRRLKDELGSRKMSRNEFSKVKEYAEKKQVSRLVKYKTEARSESGYSHRRSYSEANLNGRFRKREGIRIMNPELRDSMLIRLADYEPYLVIQKDLGPDPKLHYDHSDRGMEDMDYDPNKKDHDASRVTENVSSITRLPPIERRPTPPAVKEEEMVLTRLQRQLHDKLKV